MKDLHTLIYVNLKRICKFRISAHSLEIEKGRYYNIPRENCVCLSCKAGKVEDELHLFLDCPSYAHLRQDFLEKIKSILGEVNQKLYLLYKRWLGWISLGHAFIHKIDNDIEKFWWIAVQ